MIPSWLTQNWFQLVQTSGIVAGLVLSSWAAYWQFRALRVEGLMRLTEGHRALWQRALERPSLLRVTNPSADLAKEPVSGEERLFVLLLVLHLEAALEGTRARAIPRIWGLERDVRAFFALPIPRAVWTEVRELQSPNFRAYVEAQMARAAAVGR